MMITAAATLIGMKHFAGATIVAGALRIVTITTGVFAAAIGSILAWEFTPRQLLLLAATTTNLAFGIPTDTTISSVSGTLTNAL